MVGPPGSLPSALATSHIVSPDSRSKSSMVWSVIRLIPRRRLAGSACIGSHQRIMGALVQKADAARIEAPLVDLERRAGERLRRQFLDGEEHRVGRAGKAPVPERPAARL